MDARLDRVPTDNVELSNVRTHDSLSAIYLPVQGALALWKSGIMLELVMRPEELWMQRGDAAQTCHYYTRTVKSIVPTRKALPYLRC